jgi:hypothetical protein
MSLILNGTTGVSNVQSGVIQPEDLTGNQTGDAPIYGCRAWVNFDGTRNVTDTGASTNGQPVKIRASGNVTSVTKNGAGDYTVNFITAMEDVNYSISGSVGTGSSGRGLIVNNNYNGENSTTGIRLIANNTGFVNDDQEYLSISIFR